MVLLVSCYKYVCVVFYANHKIILQCIYHNFGGPQQAKKLPTRFMGFTSFMIYTEIYSKDLCHNNVVNKAK